jgi:hypothetical protein
LGVGVAIFFFPILFFFAHHGGVDVLCNDVAMKGL